jgi:hypothetical protein
MGKGKIDDVKLKRLIRSGKTVNHCAQVFDCTVQAIRQRLKAMDIIVGRHLAMNVEKVERISNQTFDAADEVQRLYKSTVETLERLERAMKGEIDPSELDPILAGKTSPGEMYIKVVAETRKQLSFMNDIFKTYFDIKQVQHFQQRVIEILRECDPAVAREFVERMSRERALHSSIALT